MINYHLIVNNLIKEQYIVANIQRKVFFFLISYTLMVLSVLIITIKDFSNGIIIITLTIRGVNFPWELHDEENTGWFQPIKSEINSLISEKSFYDVSGCNISGSLRKHSDSSDIILGDPGVTANLYCNFAYLYWESCVICSNWSWRSRVRSLRPLRSKVNEYYE